MMGTSRLQDDLLQGFNEEKKLIREQLELFDPLGVSLRLPAAQRLLNKSLLIACEILCYLLFAGMIVVIVVRNNLYPFYLLNIPQHLETAGTPGKADLRVLEYTVVGLLAVIALLFLVIARITRRVRLKNDILNLAGKHIKTLVGQHLKRKASLDAIEQRHFLELPSSGMEDLPGPQRDAGDTDRWDLEERLKP